MTEVPPTSGWREWRWPVFVLLATVFFIPMRRYTLPSALPFHLEPYRPIVALLIGLWALGLLMMKIRLPQTSLTVPMVLFGFAVIASLVANPSRILSETNKSLFLFATFFAIFFFMVSIVRSAAEIDTVVKAMVAFGAIVGLFAVIESRTGFSPFVGLDRIVPVLSPLPGTLVVERGGRFRAFASSEHPIALAALLAMLVPFALYLATSTRQWRWWVLGTLLFVGTVSTVSRTAVLMLAVTGVVLVLARWSDVRRLWPLVFPLLAVVHVMVPGTMGTLRSAFFPEGGLIAEQQTYADSESTAGRIADIAPSLDEFEQRPLLGEGFGTRIVTGPNANSRLLDNQWLGLLLDTGLLGVGAFVFLVTGFVRRQLRLARDDPGANGYLPLACAAAVAGYAVGMFTYDAFSFTQTTFVLFAILALGSSYELAIRESEAQARRPLGVAATTPARVHGV